MGTRYHYTAHLIFANYKSAIVEVHLMNGKEEIAEGTAKVFYRQQNRCELHWDEKRPRISKEFEEEIKDACVKKAIKV